MVQYYAHQNQTKTQLVLSLCTHTHACTERERVWWNNIHVKCNHSISMNVHSKTAFWAINKNRMPKRVVSSAYMPIGWKKTNKKQNNWTHNSDYRITVSVLRTILKSVQSEHRMWRRREAVLLAYQQFVDAMILHEKQKKKQNYHSFSRNWVVASSGSEKKPAQTGCASFLIIRDWILLNRIVCWLVHRIAFSFSSQFRQMGKKRTQQQKKNHREQQIKMRKSIICGIQKSMILNNLQTAHGLVSLIRFVQ